mmetsp:Transcript_24785/g.45453  ORF Transcript_24785/g.45453 Transcript_24785/m.45453 type:complete len:569 (-) Transcript_24785:168-1874(-)
MGAAIYCCVHGDHHKDPLASRREILEVTQSQKDHGVKAGLPDIQVISFEGGQDSATELPKVLQLGGSSPRQQLGKLPLDKPPAEDKEETGLSPTSAEVLAKMRENAALPPEAANETVWNRHKAFQERKRLKQEKRKLRARRGNSLRDGFLSNVPEVEADIQYRFNFIVMGIASEVVVTIVCGSEEAKEMELRMNGQSQSPHYEALESDENLGSMESIQSANLNDGSPTRRLKHVSTGGSIASDVNTIEAEMALQSEGRDEDDYNLHGSERSYVHQDPPMMGSERSQLSSANSAQSLQFEPVNSAASAISFDGSTSLTPSPDASELLQDRSMNGSQRSLLSAGTSKFANRCLCPVPYPWGRTKNQDRVKLAKLVFTARTFSEAIMPCETRLEAASTSLVIALIVDPAESEPSFEAQLHSLVEAIEESGYTRPHLRPARAVLLIQRSQHQRVQGNWEAHLQAFEKAYGALWRFGPTKMAEANDMYAVFAKIASQRIFEAQNNQNDPGSEGGWSDEEDDDEWDLNMRVGYKSERGGRTPSELMAASAAQDAPAAPRKKLLSAMYNSLRGRG